MKHLTKDNSLSASHAFKLMKGILENLPHAFDEMYWDMADTTYKEEIVLAAIESLELKGAKAKSFLRRCSIFKKDSPVLYFYFDGHLEYTMGCFHGKDDIGNRFINKWNGWPNNY